MKIFVILINLCFFFAIYVNGINAFRIRDTYFKGKMDICNNILTSSTD